MMSGVLAMLAGTTTNFYLKKCGKKMKMRCGFMYSLILRYSSDYLPFRIEGITLKNVRHNI